MAYLIELIGLVEVGADDHTLEVLFLIWVLEILADPFKQVIEPPVNIWLQIKFRKKLFVSDGRLLHLPRVDKCDPIFLVQQQHSCEVLAHLQPLVLTRNSLVLSVDGEAKLAFIHAEHDSDHASFEDLGGGVRLSLFEAEDLSIAAIELEAVPEVEAVFLQVCALLLDAHAHAGRHHLLDLEQNIIVALDGVQVGMSLHGGRAQHCLHILICSHDLGRSLVVGELNDLRALVGAQVVILHHVESLGHCILLSLKKQIV